MWWTPSQILPYQRNFNFVNAERSVGKTYNTQIFLLKKAIKENRKFISLFRTKKEIEMLGRFAKLFDKVVTKEFKDSNITFDKYYCYLNSNESKQKRVLGRAIALSDAVDIKQESFPDYYYMYMEEYMLEQKGKGHGTKQYVNGWKEPDLFLNIYHTVDREEDKVICFLLGNNTAFYNPYHMHPAFNIPFVNKGEIWTSENVLFQWAIADNELKEKKSKSKFLRMIENTNYGKYAVHGDYVDDNYEFIKRMDTACQYTMTLYYNGLSFGVFTDRLNGLIYISNKVDASCRLVYALTVDDHKENTMLTRASHSNMLKWLGYNFKLGNVRFVSMEVKMLIEGGLRLIL